MAKSERLQLRIDPDKKKQLEDKIKSEGYDTVSEWFNSVLRNYLKGVDKK